ncbi:MAG: hypothetical protein CK425_08030 [Parachlamydia sp.]|nr:MAG: hypothetical protein CK425_08030 [Parachlamydia sp.]
MFIPSEQLQTEQLQKIEKVVLPPPNESISSEILQTSDVKKLNHPRRLAPTYLQIREELQEKGLIGEDGWLTKKLKPLQPLKNLDRFSATLNKPINISTKNGHSLANLPHSELIMHVQEACAGIFKKNEIQLRGSSAAYAGCMEESFMEALLELDCEDLIELAKNLDPIVESDDLDWLFKIVMENEETCIDVKALRSLKNKLIGQVQHITSLSFTEVRDLAFINLSIPHKKNSERQLVLAEQFLIASLGDKNLKTDFVIGSPKRDHLFVHDNWVIEIDPKIVFSKTEKELQIWPKTSAENPYQPVFDKRLKMLHIDDPKTVNTEGLMTLLIHLSKGATYFPSQVPLLKKLCLKGKNIEKLSRLLKRRLASHSANPIAVTFNASILKARISLKNQKRKANGLVKEDFDFKLFWKEMRAIFPKNEDLLNLVADAVENQCSFERIWAVLHLAACVRLNEASSTLENDVHSKVYRVFEPRGMKIQIDVKGHYLVFPLDLSGAVFSLDSIPAKELSYLKAIWLHLIPADFNPALDTSPLLKDLDKMPNFLEDLKNCYEELLCRKSPFLKEIGLYLANAHVALNAPMTDKTVLIKNMPDILQAATTHIQRQTFFDLFCRWEPLTHVDFQSEDPPRKVIHRWILSLCQKSQFDHQVMELWKDIKGKIPKEELSQYALELIESLSNRPEKALALLKENARLLGFPEQIQAFESVCRGYQRQSIPVDATTFLNLRNLLISFSQNKEKLEISRETFEWLIQKVKEKETSLATLDFLAKLKDKSLYPYQDICNQASKICLEILAEEGFDKAFIALQKIYSWLVSSEREQCIKHFTAHPDSFQNEPFLIFLSQNSSAEISKLKESYFARVIDQALNIKDLPLALSCLKHGEEWISVEIAQNLKIQLFKLLIELDEHEKILKSLQDKQTISFGNEVFAPLWIDYFRGLICNPHSTDALWKMQRAQIITEQSVLLNQLTDEDYIAWIDFFSQIPKPVGEKTYRGLTSYESMLLQLVNLTMNRSENCKVKLIIKTLELFSLVDFNNQSFCNKLQDILLKNFMHFVKSLEKQPQHLITFLHLSSCIHLPLNQDQSEIAISAFSQMLQTTTEKDQLIQNSTILKFLVNSPGASTQKNALEAFKTCILHVAQLDEADQLKWLPQLMRLVEKNASECHPELYEILVAQIFNLIDQAKFDASLAFLKLSLSTRVEDHSSCAGLLRKICQAKYNENPYACFKLLRDHSNQFKELFKSNELKEFLIDLTLETTRSSPKPAVWQELFPLIQTYDIKLPLSLFKDLLEQSIAQSDFQAGLLLAQIWENTFKTYDPSLETEACWKLVIEICFTKKNQKACQKILQQLANKEINFSTSEGKYSIFEKTLTLFSNHFSLNAELVSNLSLIRQELLHANHGGRFAKPLSLSLKKLLAFSENREICMEAFSALKEQLEQPLFLLFLKRLHCLNEEEYHLEILEILQQARHAKIACPSLIFDSLVCLQNPSFYTCQIETLIDIVDKSSTTSVEKPIDQKFQKTVQKFLQSCLNLEEKKPKIFEALNALFNLDISCLLSTKLLQPILYDYVKQCVGLITSENTLPIEWIQSQISKIDIDTRSEINQIFYKRIYNFFGRDEDLEIFKEIIKHYIELQSNELLSFKLANIDFILTTTNHGIYHFFRNESKDDFFLFLKDIFEDITTDCKEIDVKNLHAMFSHVIANLVSFKDERMLARGFLAIAKKNGVFEEMSWEHDFDFDWDEYYYGAYKLLTQEVQDIQYDNLLSCFPRPSEPGIAREDYYTKDGLMVMSLLAAQIFDRSPLGYNHSKSLILKILVAASPLLKSVKSPFLKTVFLREYFYLQSWIAKIEPDKMNLEECLEILECIKLWGTHFLVINQDFKDLMRADRIEDYVNSCSEVELAPRQIITYDTSKKNLQEGSETNPYRLYFPKMLFPFAVRLSIKLAERIKHLDSSTDITNLENFLLNFTLDAIKQNLFSRTNNYLFDIIKEQLFPFFVQNLNTDCKKIENDPILKLMSPLSSIEKTKNQQIKTLKIWLHYLESSEKESIKAYCSALLEYLVQHGFIVRNKKNFQDLKNIGKKKLRENKKKQNN